MIKPLGPAMANVLQHYMYGPRVTEYASFIQVYASEIFHLTSVCLNKSNL